MKVIYRRLFILLLTFTTGAGPIWAASTKKHASRPKVYNARYFGTVEITADFDVDGAGKDIDTIAFWEAPEPENTLMYVTSKGTPLVEVWKFPFRRNEQTPLRHSTFGTGSAEVNGVIVDQHKNLLYVVTSEPVSTISVFSCPDGSFVRELNQGRLNLAKEPNLDLYFHDDGRTWLYVTADRIVHIFDTESGDIIGTFSTGTDVETVLADEYWQRVFVPDERGKKGIFVFNPDGTPYTGPQDNPFGADGIFQSDAEGILLYTFAGDDEADDGTGFIVLSDQREDQNDYEFFDRQTFQHMGTLRLRGVSNTDGIASTQKPLPGYPMGLFAAVNNDRTTAGVGWDDIFAATGIVTGVDDTANSRIPTDFSLGQSYPNPFNPSVTIRYELAASGQVSLKVFDTLGREVATLVDEKQPAGYYKLQFDGRNLASGVYLYRLNVGNYAEARKMVLSR